MTRNPFARSILGLLAAAASCGGSAPKPGPLLDSVALDTAIRAETNARRAAAGLKALKSCEKCTAAAQGHAADMVRLNFFEHENPDSKRETVSNRMAAVGVVKPKMVGENISMLPGLNHPDGRPYRPPTEPGEPATDLDGNVIPLHTVETLARQVVDDWMDSPPHRENILTPGWLQLGSACVSYLDAAEDDAPMFKCVQVFLTP